MWRNFAQTFERHLHHGYPYGTMHQEKFLLTMNFLFGKLKSVSALQHSTRHIYEEDTFSYKILQYFRNSTFYSTSRVFPKVHKYMSVNYVEDEKYTIQRLMVTIAHSTVVKVEDILHLFSLFASSQHSMMQILISDTVLISDIQSKIIGSLHLMDVKELQHLAILLRKLKNQRAQFLYIITSSLVSHCEMQAKEANLSKALWLFDVLLILYGNGVNRRKEYEAFMSIFETKLNTAQPHELVQILHYIGIGKTKRLSKEFTKKTVKKLELDFTTLSFCDVGIAAVGVFKAGLAMDKSSVFVTHSAQLLHHRLMEHSTLSDLESYAIVSLIKFLRLAKYKNDEILSELSQFIQENNEINLTRQSIPHFLAFYANMRVYEKDVFELLEKQVLEQWKQEPSRIRIKDIARVLWCFSYTGHDFSAEFLIAVDKYLSSVANGPEIVKNSQHLSDMLLSLAICNHYPLVIKKAFTPAMVEGLKGHQRSKQLSRLCTLYESVQIEMPDLVVEKPHLSQDVLPVRTLSDELFHRRGLAKVMEGAKFVNKVIGSNVFRLKFLLPSINYANICLDHRELQIALSKSSQEEYVDQIHIIEQLSLVHEGSHGSLLAVEILEPEFLINPTLSPVGIVSLKLRLLRHSGWNVKVLLYKEVEECGNDIKAVAALLIDRIVSCK